MTLGSSFDHKAILWMVMKALVGLLKPSAAVFHFYLSIDAMLQ